MKPSLSGRPTPTGDGDFSGRHDRSRQRRACERCGERDLSQLTVGTHVITFQYSGDANFQPNTASSAITVTTAPAPDFSIGSSPASLSVTPGQTVKAQLTITANAGLSRLGHLRVLGSTGSKALAALLPRVLRQVQARRAPPLLASVRLQQAQRYGG